VPVALLLHHRVFAYGLSRTPSSTTHAAQLPAAETVSSGLRAWAVLEVAWARPAWAT